MRLTIALLFFIYSINSLQAQVIKILDQETQEPIENAALHMW